MTTLYVGTSSARAPYLVALGWKNLTVTPDVAFARRMARIAAIEDACDGVVMAVDSPGEVAGSITSIDVTPGDAVPVEVTDGDTPEERLGFDETAGGVSDVVSGLLSILDQTHSTVRNMIDVGKGDANVELPHLRELKDRWDQQREAMEEKRFLKSIENLPEKARHKKLKEFKEQRAQKKHDTRINRLKTSAHHKLAKIQRAINHHIQKLKAKGPPKTKTKVSRPTSPQNAPTTQNKVKRSTTKFAAAPKTKNGHPENPSSTFKTSKTTQPRKTAAPRKAAKPSGPPKGVDAGDWWKKLTRQEQIQYIKDHPESLKKQTG